MPTLHYSFAYKLKGAQSYLHADPANKWRLTVAVPPTASCRLQSLKAHRFTCEGQHITQLVPPAKITLAFGRLTYQELQRTHSSESKQCDPVQVPLPRRPTRTPQTPPSR
jgi:hypothetical protein